MCVGVEGEEFRMELVCSHTFWPLRRKGVSSATFTAALSIRTLPSAITAPAITSAAACCYSAKRRREWLFLILVYSHRVWHGVNSMRARTRVQSAFCFDGRRVLA